MLFYLLINLVMWIWGITSLHESALGLFAFISFIECCIEIWFLIVFITWIANKNEGKN